VFNYCRIICNKYYVIKPFCVRSKINSSILLSNSGTTNSGLIIYGPFELVGLNPSIIAVVASSTYLLIKKWSKLNIEELALTGRGLLKWTSIDPVWNNLPEPLSEGLNTLPTW
jgi:hypothetical protein